MERPMPPGIRAVAIVLLAAVFLWTLAPDAGAVKIKGTGTIVLASGERFEEVEFEADTRFHVIRIELEDGQKIVSFSNVAKIVQDGEDTTVKFIGERKPTESKSTETSESEAATETTGTESIADEVQSSDPPTEDKEDLDAEWISRHDKEYKAAIDPTWSVAIELHGGFGAPLGSYYDGVNPGTNFGADLMIAVTRQFAFRASFTRLGWGDDFDTLLDPSILADAKITGLRFLGAGQYYRHLRACQKTKFTILRFRTCERVSPG
jgi:hypothetical protein